MKKTYLILAMSVAVFAGMISCSKKGCTDAGATNYDEKVKKDDGSCTFPVQTTISENITENTTWTSGNIYTIGARIAVTSGVTLTIEPGVVIKGESGTGANATSLIIAQGGKIMAEGTAEKPIIFTSVSDNIQPGEIASPNLDPTLSGLWGGLIILGKAPISADASTAQIEGIPASDANGLFGGSDATDNSGVLKYVSIRHGGANIGEGNEINGLTLGGVGSGTTIENIEIVSNQDDGIEWFGGSVNVKNVVVWNTGDDAIDTDMAWSGTLDNFVIINPGDECFELDGGEGSTNAKHILKNGTVQASNADGLVDMDFKGAGDAGNSSVEFDGIYFFDLTSGQDFEADTSFSTATDVTITSIQTTIPTGGNASDYFKGGSDASVTTINRLENTVGADLTQFTGWSWAEVDGALGFE